MSNNKNNVSEKDCEEALLSKYSTEEDVCKISLEKPRAASAGVTPPKARFATERERSQSLYSFGNNLKQRQRVFTAAVPEHADSEDHLPNEKRLSTPTATLPKSSRPSKKFRRLNALLLEAVRYRSEDEIERLIIAGANPNATCCAECVSACHLAAMRSDGALALLLSHGADKHRSDRIGRTPLHLAAWAGNVRQMAMLLGFSKDLTNKVSNTTLSPVVEDEVRKLSPYLKELVNVKCHMSQKRGTLPKDWADNMIDHNCKEFEKNLLIFQPGWTPLHAASTRVQFGCVRLLILAGADPCVRDLVGRTPLDIVGSTHYNDEYVDPKRFSDTVSILAEGKCNLSLKNRRTLDSPLHTAVELNSIEAVRALTSVSVPVKWLNRAGLTPLHICVKKKLCDILQVLVNVKLDETEVPAVDVRDKDGRTVLHAAVLEGWVNGVAIALEAGASVMAKDHNDETAIHLAAATGNLDILNLIVTVAKQVNAIDIKNSQKETPLFKAVMNGHTECVKRLLQEKACIMNFLPNEVTIFHVAAEKGNLEVLQVLLDHDYVLTRAMVNFLTSDKNGFGPIHYAVQNNHPKCVKLLLSKNSYRCLKSTPTGTYTGSTPLHIAAIYNNVEIAKIIMKNNPDTVHKVNDLDWTPLHTACQHGSRDLITMLLKEGADLSGTVNIPDKTETTAIDLIMNNLSKPTEFLNDVFDTYISTNDLNIQDPNCEVTVNYQVLVPKDEDTGQMRVLEALLTTGDRYGQRRLLVHPLVESFLHLKWKILLPFFYTMIMLYGLYVMTLTMYVLSVFFYKDRGHKTPSWLEPTVLAIFLDIIVILVIVQEALYIKMNTRYLLQLETWVKFVAMFLAVSLPYALALTNDATEDFPRHMATMALLLSWLEMMFLLSRFPNWGYYVLMFGKVSSNVIKILLTFSFLVIGFSLSFMVQFHHQTPFEGPWAAFVKIMVMMTSEFDYGDLMEGMVPKSPKNATNSTSILNGTEMEYSLLVVRLIFLVFLILAAIVLMNLMVGVAVYDLHNLQVLGNIRRLTKQVEFLISLETLVYNKYTKKLLPTKIERMIFNKTILKVIVLKPSDREFECYKSLTSDLRDVIFEKAQSQQKRIEEQIGSQMYKKKLDEIYEATVNNSKIREHPEVRRILSHDSSKKNNMEMISKMIVDLDTGVANIKKQTAVSIEEMKSAIRSVHAKMDIILEKLEEKQGKPPERKTQFYL
ncbi:transient receptor potential cation channel subfamily A member 1-like [Anticarsia gemmatalis]|uniref:transient receptor potential cation channel subfamily A member 1-like n=1 Tax=Anticarsia gemmatalis TaxID=129554 RepID=UPI003F76C896